MMAELVQGQASVAQPGTKDDFADTIRRVRQVKCPLGESAFAGGVERDFGQGYLRSLTINTPYAHCELAS